MEGDVRKRWRRVEPDHWTGAPPAVRTRVEAWSGRFLAIVGLNIDIILGYVDEFYARKSLMILRQEVVVLPK